MAQVTLQINGYGYILGCADGEEDHLCALAADLDRRIDEIKVATGPSGEARMLLMAALMISDELHDLRQQVDTGSPSSSPKTEPKIGRRLRGIAKRAESIADEMETQPSTTPPETAPHVETPMENVAVPPDQP